MYYGYNERPLTNAESTVMVRLANVAELGDLYLKLLYYTDSDITCEFYRKEMDVPDSIQNFMESTRETIAEAEKFIGEELMRRIDNYNKACAKVHEDTRPRNEILQAEGWKKTSTGWKNGSGIIIDKKNGTTRVKKLPRKHVYIFSLENDTVKIGVSNDVNRRRRKVMNSSGLEIGLWCYTEAFPEEKAFWIESALHRIFTAYRTKGEFFKIPYSTVRNELETYAEVHEERANSN